jgi:TatD DNase family protein
LSWGFHISFAGNVTYPKAEELRIAAKAVPLDRLLVETDAPYLAPQVHRGKRCEPAYTQHTAEFLAEFLDVPYEDLARMTAENAAKLYRIPTNG